MEPEPTSRPVGRPRSEEADRKILDAARDLLVAYGYDRLRLEHVAKRAGVGKATIYRRWGSKEELAGALLEDLASPTVAIPDTGNAREEFTEVAINTINALADTPYGPVIRALLSQIAINPRLGNPFRASVVEARRRQVAAIVERGIARGELKPETESLSIAEMLVGPVYYRLIFGGSLDRTFVDEIVTGLLNGCGASRPR